MAHSLMIMALIHKWIYIINIHFWRINGQVKLDYASGTHSLVSMCVRKCVCIYAMHMCVSTCTSVHTYM